MAVHLDRALLADFARRHRIRRLALFGSALRDDFGPESDIDLLVAFEPDAAVGLIALAAMELELTRLLGRRVEIHTEAGIDPRYRDAVLRERVIQYEQA